MRKEDGNDNGGQPDSLIDESNGWLVVAVVRICSDVGYMLTPLESGALSSSVEGSDAMANTFTALGVSTVL